MTFGRGIVHASNQGRLRCASKFINCPGVPANQHGLFALPAVVGIGVGEPERLRGVGVSQNFFDVLGVAGRFAVPVPLAETGVLVWGAPGAGKTTLLLELAGDLIARAEQDDEQLDRAGGVRGVGDR